MKQLFGSMLAVAATSAIAQVDRAGNVMSDDGGGSFGIGALIAAVIFFGGIYWFMTRFDNEMQGTLYLFGGVFLFLVIVGVVKCAG